MTAIENERSRRLLTTERVPKGGQVIQNGQGSYTDMDMWKLTLVQ